MAESVVDYAAWKKGYMPPCEHVLIHELSHCGAKVNCMSSAGTATWWFVTKGEINRKQLSAISKMLHEMAMDLDVPKPEGDAQAGFVGIETET